MPRPPDNGKAAKVKVYTRIDPELKEWGLQNKVNFSYLLEQKLIEEKTKMSSPLDRIDYSVQFANIQRVIYNIPEPWKTELADAASDLQEAIQNDLETLRKISREEYREIQNFNPSC